MMSMMAAMFVHSRNNYYKFGISSITIHLRKYGFIAEEESQEVIHPFKKIITKQEVLKLFSNKILYNDGSIAAFNKPAGVAKTRSPDEPSNALKGSMSNVCMDDVMADLKKILPNFSRPTIVKFPEKFTSGLLIIAANEVIAEKVDKCKRIAKTNHDYYDKYFVVCQDKPAISNGAFRLAVKLSGNEKNKRKVRLIVDTWANNEMKRNDVKIFSVAHNTIQIGTLASLCSVSLSSPSKNSMRLYFATKLLSPLLGDIKFSSRVNHVLGVPLLLDPFSDIANSPKRLPAELLKALRLQRNEGSLVPQCVHLAEVTLPSYLKNGKPLLLRAPVPDTFRWVCRQLQIYDDALDTYGTYGSSIDTG